MNYQTREDIKALIIVAAVDAGAPVLLFAGLIGSAFYAAGKYDERHPVSSTISVQNPASARLSENKPYTVAIPCDPTGLKSTLGGAKPQPASTSQLKLSK